MREWAQTIALVLLFFVVGVEALWTNGQVMAIAQRTAQQEALVNGYFKAAAAEANYDCATLNAIAHKANFALPFASPSTCSVTAP